MKKLYVHIGTHKTGTTSLQNQLLRHRYSFLKHNAFYIPTSGLLNKISNLKKHDQNLVEKVKNELQTQIQKFNSIETFVTSSEHLSGNAVTGYNNSLLMSNMLLDIVSDLDCEVYIILYLRRQDRFIESLYAHLIEGNKISIKFEEFVSNIHSDSFNWEKLIKSFEKNFNKDRLIIRSYDLVKKEDFFKDFFKILDIPGVPNYWTNVSTSGVSVELQRVCNEILGEKKAKEITKFIRKEYRSKNLDSRIAKNIFFSNFHRKKFIKSYKKSNDIVSKRYSIKLFDEADDNYENFQASDQDIFSELISIIEILMKQKRNRTSIQILKNNISINFIKLKKLITYLSYKIKFK